jgi:ABC-type Fe3+-hydroxamate transport system substrate-binding protein
VKQPDVVLVNSKIGDLRLKEDEFFSQLDAVTQGRIIMLNNLHFERPSARMITLINSMSAQYKDLGVAGT